jgi:single-strand DNA-binding protein
MNPQDIIPAIIRAELHHFRGRLGKDPEIKYLKSGKIVASASMAVNPADAKRDDGTQPDWFNLELWGEQAEAFANQFHRGDMVLVVGRVRIDRWIDRQTGDEKMKLVVLCDAVNDGSPEATAAALGQQQAMAPAVAPPQATQPHPAQGQVPAAPPAAAPVWESSSQPAAPAPAAAPPAPPAAPSWATNDPPF